MIATIALSTDTCRTWLIREIQRELATTTSFPKVPIQLLFKLPNPQVVLTAIPS